MKQVRKDRAEPLSVAEKKKIEDQARKTLGQLEAVIARQHAEEEARVRLQAFRTLKKLGLLLPGKARKK